MTSPPLSPMRQYFSHGSTPPSAHRLSSASRYSTGSQDLVAALDAPAGGQGLGNLADELEFADEDELDEEWDSDAEGGSYHSLDDGPPALRDADDADGPRDSGVSIKSPHRNFSRPISRDSESSEPPNIFSVELEGHMAQISRLANPAAHQNPDTISRTLLALQSLTPQQSLEAHTQRLTTSANSLTSHLLHQTKHFASLSSALFSPFGFGAPLDPQIIDQDLLPAIVQLLQDLPTPDARSLHGLARLDRDTTDLLQALSALSDSLQMGRQTTASAARHLRNTQTMVSEMRREIDVAEQARWRLEREGWDQRLAERTCARECADVVGGFESVCEGLRKGLEEKIVAA